MSEIDITKPADDSVGTKETIANAEDGRDSDSENDMDTERDSGRHSPVDPTPSIFYTWRDDLEGDDADVKQYELARLIDGLPKLPPDEKKRTVYLPEDTFSIMAISWPPWYQQPAGAPPSVVTKADKTPVDSKSSQGAADIEAERVESVRLALALSFLVFIIQAGTLFLVSKDILDHGDSIFGQFTTRVVRWAQLIAILITILSQTDIISAIDVWINGRPGRGNIVKPSDDDAGKHTNDTPVYEFEPNAVLWHVSNLLRFVEGFACLAVTFLLVMNSTDVRDVLLNFTAAEFISNVDNAVYQLAKWRYFGKPIRRIAKHPIISEDDLRSYPTEKPYCWGWIHNQARALCLVTLTLFGLVSWALFCRQQIENLPKSFFVQFGDDEDFALGFASGIYTQRPLPKQIMVTSSELIYDLDDQHNFSESERTSIKYCSEDFTWRLMKIGDTCADGKWFVRSSVIDDSAFSLPSSDDQNWYVQNGDYDTGGDYEMRMEYIRIIKLEELREPTEDDFGSGCLFRDEGEDLLGPVEPSDLDVGFTFGNAHYQMLRGVSSYRRPVYARRTNRGVAVLMSVGRRWAHVYGGSQYALGRECDRDMDFPESRAVVGNEPMFSFFPFTVDEQESISVMVRTMEWQLRSRVADVKVLPDWDYESMAFPRTCITNPCVSEFAFWRAVPTFFSDPFNIQSHSDSGSPTLLQFHKTPNYPVSNGNSYPMYRLEEQLGPYNARTLENESVKGFSRCEERYSGYVIKGCDNQVYGLDNYPNHDQTGKCFENGGVGYSLLAGERDRSKRFVVHPLCQLDWQTR